MTWPSFTMTCVTLRSKSQLLQFYERYFGLNVDRSRPLDHLISQLFFPFSLILTGGSKWLTHLVAHRIEHFSLVSFKMTSILSVEGRLPAFTSTICRGQSGDTWVLMWGILDSWYGGRLTLSPGSLTTPGNGSIEFLWKLWQKRKLGCWYFKSSTSFISLIHYLSTVDFMGHKMKPIYIF